MATVTAPAPGRSSSRSAPAAPLRHPGGAFRPSPSALLARLGLVLATGAGGAALALSYGSPVPVLVVLAVCATASVTVALLLRCRFSALRTVLTGIPLPLIAVLVSAVWIPGEENGEGGLTGVLRGAGEALLHSGARILTTAAPTPLTVDTLTLPFLATWLTGTATALAWHADRRALALLPGLLLLVGAVALNGPAAPPGFGSIGLLGVAAVLVMSVRTGDGRRGSAGSSALGIQVDALPEGRSRVRDAAVTGAICVLTAATAVLGGPHLLAGWAAEPGDPRTVLTPPLDPHDARNPLSYLPGWAAEPDEHLLTVESDQPLELRWVAFADFTGTTWLPESGYRSAGQILPEPVPPPPGAEEATANITVGEDLPGSWAPVVGAPREVGLDHLGYDALTGTVVTLDGDVAGRSYEAVGDVADWSGADPSRSAPPVGDVYDLYRDLPPGAPPILIEVVSEIASEGGYHHRARAIADYLRDSHTFDPNTPGGHGYAHIDALLATPGGRGGGGTSEQFASAFTMLARAAGLPSRVAVGFAAGTERAEGEYEVTTGDAYAWGEVYFDGLGWVPFHVTPGGQDDTGSGQSPEGGDDPDDPESEEFGGSSESEEQEEAPPGPSGSGLGPWVWPAAASGGLLVLILLVPALRLIRRALRLGSKEPTDRVLGAWRELREALRLSSAELSAGHTVTDTVAVARALAPPSAPTAGLDRLAAAVNGAGFGGGAGIDTGVAAEAAEAVRVHQRTLRRGRPRRARLTWWFDPRPLFWRDGPSTGRQRRGRR